MAVGTGHSATVTFTTSSYSLAARSIQLHAEDAPQVDATHLGTTGTRAYIPADLAELGDLTVEFLFDTDDGMPTIGVSEQVTVTFKLLPGEDTAATLAGNASIRNNQWPTLETNEMMVGSIVIQWEAQPTFTPAVTTP